MDAKRSDPSYTKKSKEKKLEKILKGIYKVTEEERAGEGRWDRKKEVFMDNHSL